MLNLKKKYIGTQSSHLAIFPLAKVIMITPAIATHYSDTRQSLFTCLGHLGQRDKQGSFLIFCHASQGGQGKYISDECHMSLLLMFFLTIFTINDQLTHS
jgi:hypothetical protein